MTTVYQAIRTRVQTKKKCKVPDLYGCPQKLGICVRPLIRTPKKPCSAKRKILKIKYRKNPKALVCHVPGERHSIRAFTEVLIHGHRVKDLPGMKYRVIRGYKLKNYSEVKTRARSKYGVRKAYLLKVSFLKKRRFLELPDPVTGKLRLVRGVGIVVSAKHNKLF